MEVSIYELLAAARESAKSDYIKGDSILCEKRYAALDVGHQPVELRPIENRPRPSVIHIDIDEIKIRTPCDIGLAYLNLIGDDIHLFRFNI